MPKFVSESPVYSATVPFSALILFSIDINQRRQTPTLKKLFLIFCLIVAYVAPTATCQALRSKLALIPISSLYLATALLEIETEYLPKQVLIYIFDSDKNKL